MLHISTEAIWGCVEINNPAVLNRLSQLTPCQVPLFTSVLER